LDVEELAVAEVEREAPLALTHARDGAAGEVLVDAASAAVRAAPLEPRLQPAHACVVARAAAHDGASVDADADLPGRCLDPDEGRARERIARLAHVDLLTDAAGRETTRK